jgi:hypothetical protein
MLHEQVILRRYDRLNQRLGDLGYRNPRMIEFHFLPILMLLIHTNKHQWRIIYGYKFIYHYRQYTGYKQEDQQIPAPDPYPFYQRCYHILLFGETKVKNISVSGGLKLIIYRKGTIFGF